MIESMGSDISVSIGNKGGNNQGGLHNRKAIHPWSRLIYLAQIQQAWPFNGFEILPSQLDVIDVQVAFGGSVHILPYTLWNIVGLFSHFLCAS